MASKKNKTNKKASAAKAKKGSPKQQNPLQRLRQNSREFWSQKSPILKFLLGFAGCMVLFYIIYLSPFFIENIGKPIIHAQAKAGNFLLNLIGQNTTAAGELIESESFAISVKNGCDGLEPLAILLSGILVFPVKFKFKLPGILWGILALAVLNLIRIAALYLIGLNFPGKVFDLMHEQGGFVIFTALSVFIWMFWANWAINKNQQFKAKMTVEA
jgi:exosortase/archaeosortase family protein